jgi:hypothetical protein
VWPVVWDELHRVEGPAEALGAAVWPEPAAVRERYLLVADVDEHSHGSVVVAPRWWSGRGVARSLQGACVDAVDGSVGGAALGGFAAFDHQSLFKTTVSAAAAVATRTCLCVPRQWCYTLVCSSRSVCRCKGRRSACVVTAVHCAHRAYRGRKQPVFTRGGITAYVRDEVAVMRLSPLSVCGCSQQAGVSAVVRASAVRAFVRALQRAGVGSTLGSPTVCAGQWRD